MEKITAVGNYKESDLKKKVATMLIDQLEGYDRPEDMFRDLGHGCVSGIISELIYYVDTHRFTKEYLEDIMDLLAETEESMGEPVKMTNDRLNWLAWFGFEETARIIAEELGIEY